MKADQYKNETQISTINHQKINQHWSKKSLLQTNIQRQQQNPIDNKLEKNCRENHQGEDRRQWNQKIENRIENWENLKKLLFFFCYSFSAWTE